MTLGQDFRDLVDTLMADFGSALSWRHYTRVETAETGEVEETTADEPFTGAVTDPLRLRLFSDAALAIARCAVVVPAGALATPPQLLDEVQVVAPDWLRVAEIRNLYGPGESGSPVLIAYVAALGS